jgi:hypothetical protein
MFSKLSGMASLLFSDASAGEAQESPRRSGTDKKAEEEKPALSLTAFEGACFAPLSSIPPRDPASFDRHDVPLEREARGKLAFVLDNVLSHQVGVFVACLEDREHLPRLAFCSRCLIKKECADMISATEQLGYTAALVGAVSIALILNANKHPYALHTRIPGG